MWIKEVELKNIKSYGEAQTVSFEQGVNAICGPNGAGKSTILEAVGLALFDASPYRPLKRFVREGAKRGEVVVTFVDTLNKNCYDNEQELMSGCKGQSTTWRMPTTQWKRQKLPKML